MINKEEMVKHHVDIILTKMFEMVNLDWSNPDIKAEYDVYSKESEWYGRCEWTREQRDNFTAWLTSYFQGNAGARRYLLARPNRSQKVCHKAAMEFISFFGWRLKREKE